MTRYWVVAPFAADDPEFSKVWRQDLTNSEISIGWPELGDISGLAKEDLRNLVEETYSTYAQNARTAFVNMLWKFYHEIQIGDLILARKGRRTIAAVGSASGPAYYAANRSERHPNFLPVKWHDAPRDRVLPKIAFAMQTLYEIDEALYRELVGEPSVTIAKPAESDVENETEFVLEKYLQEFVVTNFAAIFAGKLALYRDPEDNVSGEQYVTDVGKIDILAQDTRTNDLVVIELKKGREADKVVGQILRYMGWVSEHLAEESQEVRGIVICREPDPKLYYAVRMARNVEVKYYKVDFALLDSLSGPN
jgi:restriction system protein